MNTKNHQNILFYLLLGLPFYGHSAGDSQSININVSVNVVALPCNIKSQNIEFGDVYSNNLQASAAKVPLSVTCTSKPSGTLQVMFKGTPSKFDQDLLSTDIDELAIKLKADDGTTITLGKTLLTLPDSGVIYINAAPEAKPSAKLSGGDFNSTVTMVLSIS